MALIPTHKAVFTLTLAAPALAQAQVTWSIIAGTAADDVDFVNASGDVFIEEGETTAVIEVLTRSPNTGAPAAFQVQLSNPYNCSLGPDVLGDAVFQGLPTIVHDTFTGTDLSPLASHVGELNARYEMLYGDMPEAVIIADGCLRRPTSVEDGDNAGSEQTFFLSSIDLDSTAPGGTEILFSFVRMSSAYQGSFLSLYKNGDNFGNPDLLAQIGFEEFYAGTDPTTLPNPIGINTTHTVKIVISGAAVTIYLDSLLVATGEMDGPLIGKLGFAMFDSGDVDQSYKVDNFTIKGTGTPVEVVSPALFTDDFSVHADGPLIGSAPQVGVGNWVDPYASGGTYPRVLGGVLEVTDVSAEGKRFAAEFTGVEAGAGPLTLSVDVAAYDAAASNNGSYLELSLCRDGIAGLDSGKGVQIRPNFKNGNMAIVTPDGSDSSAFDFSALAKPFTIDLILDQENGLAAGYVNGVRVVQVAYTPLAFGATFAVDITNSQLVSPVINTINVFQGGDPLIPE